jgi:hypothetical protein
MHTSPVQQGVFLSGTEPVLWRSGLDRQRLRRRAIRRCVLSDPAWFGLVGALVFLIGVTSAPVLFWPVLAGTVMVMVAALMARHEYLRFGHVLSGRSASWRIDRGKGEWYFRTSDFADRGSAAQGTAARIIDAAHLSHTGPAVVWLDLTHLDSVHRLAWDALVALYEAPSAHDDLRPVVVRLELIAARVRDANRWLYHVAATTGTDDLVVRLAAVHDVLAEQAAP